ncbi:MAG: chemotaxis protein CheW [Candidatus Bathyarchaeum sp.]|nr:MAG: chemotaxis protein CheW [Candidatus Bathyarchaeum sp.]
MTKIDDQQIVNFTIGEVNYGVPVEQVREVRDMQAVTPVPGAPSYVEGVTNLRGQIITVMDLRRRLDLPKKEDGGEKIIVVELGKVAVGVVVDAVTEVSTIPGADIEEHMEVTTTLDEYVIGVGKQGENLVVILNLAKLISDVKEDLPEQRKVAKKELLIAEQVPIA